MELRIKTTKQFIQDFDFANPNFGDVPEGFPWLSKDGLTKQEGHLLDAITIAWILQQPSLPLSISAYIKTSKFIDTAFKTSLSLTIFSVIFFSFISTLYYLNIEYHLGLTFLTEFFA